jgi:glyoxylase-like metal-dependent hydrolase (beta-lactamase superfamily II)/rhodanese-related sulfurtransferase
MSRPSGRLGPGRDMDALDLAAAIEAGEPLQLVDVRGADAVAAERIDSRALGSIRTPRGLPGDEPPFFHLMTSQLQTMADPASVGLDRSRPVVVVCARGNASRGAAVLLRNYGFDAVSLRGGMAAWAIAQRVRDLEPPAGFHTLLAFERLAKSRRSYLLAAADQAVVIDIGRNLAPVLTAIEELDLSVVAVIDTHLHSDVLSGGPGLAAHVGVPYLLSPREFESDGGTGAPERVPRRFQALEVGREIGVGTNALTARATPGHTRGSMCLWVGDVAFSGDFVLGDPAMGIGRRETGSVAELAASLRDAAQWPENTRLLPGLGLGGAEFRAGSLREAWRALATRLDSDPGLAPAVSFDERENAMRRVNLGVEPADGLDAAQAQALEAGSPDLAVSLPAPRPAKR